MELEAEIKALQTKLLALETAIQKLASRKEASIDPSLIEGLTKQLTEKSAEMDGLKTRFDELVSKLTPPEPIKGGDKDHGTIWSCWGLFGR